VRRASWTTGVAAAAALALAFAARAGAAPPKPAPPVPTKPALPAPTRPDAANAPPWVADELRILRAEVESLRQRPESSAAADVAALRGEVSKLAAAQAELERRLAATPATGTPPVAVPERSVGGGVSAALVFLGLGVALGWVASRLTQRWRDRRQRIRV
jgi:hypothetical protein